MKNADTVEIGDEAVVDNKKFLEYCQYLRQKYPVNKKVLFIQIPQFLLNSFNVEVAKNKGYYAFPPTGLQCLYEALKGKDLEFRVFDLNLEILKNVHEDENFKVENWVDLLKDFLKDYDPFIIGVSCMFDAGIHPLKQVLKFLKERDRSVVIAGGVICTYEWENLLSHEECHFTIKGEAEYKLNYLFDHLTGENKNHSPTANIYFRHNGEFIETQGEIKKVNFQTNMIDSYSLVDIKQYYRYGSLNPFSRIAGIYKSPFAAIQMNRGCRAECSFCAVRDFMGKGVRSRSVDLVLEEMEYLIKEHGVKHFEWLDDDLLFLRNDLQILLQEIVDRKWNITWSANNGLIAASVDEKTMQLISDSGCIGFKIGIETGNAELLRKMKKPATLEKFRTLAALSRKYPKPFVGGNIIVGYPGETFAQLMDSYNFCMELGLDWYAFTVCQIIRGASAFNDFHDYFVKQINNEGKDIKNFIPTRDTSDGRLLTDSSVFKGLDIFRLDYNLVPSAEQVKEIWFTFNMICNFINNKNLREGGNPEKFNSWVEMAQTAYPTNPYMSLFLALGCILTGDNSKAGELYGKAIQFGNTDYWRERFNAFGLDKIVKNFPITKEEVYRSMDYLKAIVEERSLERK